MLINEKRFELDPAYPVLIPHYFRFGSRSEGPLEQFYIHFSLDNFRMHPSLPILLTSFGQMEKDEIKRRFVEVDWPMLENNPACIAPYPQKRKPLTPAAEKVLGPYACTVLRMTEMPLVNSED